MAISALGLSHKQTLTPFNSPSLNLQSRNIFFQPLSPLRNLRFRRRISISASATKIETDVEAQRKVSESRSKWKEFAENVSGEWDGFGADFTIEGNPIELPESVVPEAFREWEVKVFDWQIQCPTLAETDNAMLLYKLIRLLPTVGCEADAATQYSIDERTIGGVHNKHEVFSYHPSGCYVAVWPIEDKGTYRLLELEYCLVNPENRESRTRIVQVVRVENAVVKLESIRVFCEQWYGPFRNGEQLGGCAIRDSGFASTDALKISEVIGSWNGLCSASNFVNLRTGAIQELVDEKPQRLTRNHLGVTLLPKQLWCSVEESEHGESSAEVGWLLDSGRTLTSRCVFVKGGEVKKIELCWETKVPE